MFGRTHSKTVAVPPLKGTSEVVFCIIDEKKKVRYRLQAGKGDSTDGSVFQFLEESHHVGGSLLLDDALKTRIPASLALSYGEGRKKYFYILPYEKKRGNWRFACLQVTEQPRLGIAGKAQVCALAENRVCLMLVDPDHVIHSVGPYVPDSFGYTSQNLVGMRLQDLFSALDFEILQGSSADTSEPIASCTCSCLDGSRRKVEIRKFSTPDQYTLYGICDVHPVTRGSIDDSAEATARERRRIGQDLHDSVGQTLTGISLLSRSLSNTLRSSDHEGSGDASQISELADVASNQIRQISRGLMPAEIVRHGLIASLRGLALVTADSCKILCKTRFDESLKFEDVAVETHLYRIAQEAVNNAVRHSGASRIDITVSMIDGMHRLDVVDNGCWVEPRAGVVGIGLKTMKYRASAIEGELHIGKTQQGGTLVSCRFKNEGSLEAEL
ncbi:MAG: sensor histidine kinase [Verrucomicrobiota bacterium]